MHVKLSPETTKLMLVSLCTLICSTTAIVATLAPFGVA
jgi:hypothetical protein